MPNAKPAGGVVGLDTPPPGQTDMPLATRRLPGAQGRLALKWGLPTLLDCIGTGGAAQGWVASHGGLAVQLEGPRGR